jgi:polysaccharide export outer membrane protein
MLEGGVAFKRQSLRRGLALVAGCLLLGSAAAGCGGAGEFVWFHDLPPEAAHATNEYVIGVGDTLSIKVAAAGVVREEMTLHQRVRADGRIGVLLIGDVEAKGKRPSALKAELEGRLKDYILTPSVVVNVDEVQPSTVIVMGEVARPGPYSLDQDPRLVHALAAAGGLTDYASRSHIFVVRSEPKTMRIRFTYEGIYRNAGGAGDFVLHRGDVVEVE